jgi:predicted O-methyltransferase YrrM/SAM-dependent methyltransferase
VAWADEVPAGLPPLQQAALERRRSLLAMLPVGSLVGRVGVELGTGAGVWRDDRFAGADASADVFFARDGLDRVDDTERMLDEIHRLLRPGGQLVAAVTNADAHLFARARMRHGVAADRPGLVGYDELLRLLAPRFEVVASHGYNATLHPTLDPTVGALDFARAWCGQLDARPDLATHVVLLARSRGDWRPGRRGTRVVGADDPAIAWEGPWARAHLADGIDGWLGSGGDASVLQVEVHATDVLVFLWSHGWSGRASIAVDGVERPVELYAPESGFRRVHLRGLTPGSHHIRVRGSRGRHPRGAGDQVIFHKLIAYDDPTHRLPSAEEPAMDSDASMGTRPGRFGIIYTTPAHMTGSERVLLYGFTFGLRPARTLEIGTFRGGSALVICAALDDIGSGALVCVDPAPQVAPEHWAQISHRATLFAEPSPDVLPRAMDAAGGPFDLALIDGDHQFAGVVRDIEGVLPVLAPEAHLLFHDAHYFEVAAAIDRMLAAHADVLSDCGMVSTERTVEDRTIDGHQVVWGGLRLLRYRRPR